jgi:hypothetical protein
MHGWLWRYCFTSLFFPEYSASSSFSWFYSPLPGLPLRHRKPVLIPWAAFGPSEEKTVLLTSTLYTTVRTPEGKDVPIRFKNIELHGYLLKKLPRQDALPPKVVPPIALPDSET